MRCEEHSHPETGSPLFLLGTEPVSLTVGKAREAAAFHIAWSKQQLPRGCLLMPVCGDVLAQLQLWFRHGVCL